MSATNTAPPAHQLTRTPATYPGLYRGVLERVKHLTPEEFASYADAKRRRDRRYAWSALYWMAQFSFFGPLVAAMIHPGVAALVLLAGVAMPLRAKNRFKSDLEQLALSDRQARFVDREVLIAARSRLAKRISPRAARDPFRVGIEAAMVADELFGSFDNDAPLFDQRPNPHPEPTREE